MNTIEVTEVVIPKAIITRGSGGTRMDAVKLNSKVGAAGPITNPVGTVPDFPDFLTL